MNGSEKGSPGMGQRTASGTCLSCVVVFAGHRRTRRPQLCERCRVVGESPPPSLSRLIACAVGCRAWGKPRQQGLAATWAREFVSYFGKDGYEDSTTEAPAGARGHCCHCAADDFFLRPAHP